MYPYSENMLIYGLHNAMLFHIDSTVTRIYAAPVAIGEKIWSIK